MASPARSRTREEERRLSISTLVIASIASLIAAVVTSHFWLAGTPLAAAATPVIVAIVSELLRKPTEVISQRLTTGDRTAVVPDSGSAVPRPPEPERRPGEAAAGAGRRREPAEQSRSERERLQRATSATVAKAGVPPAGGMHVYRPTRSRRRRIAVGVVAATAVLAFAIAAAVLTLPELIAGQSLTKSSRHTTLFGGSAKKKTTTTPTQTTPTQSQPSTTPKSTTTNRTNTQTAPSGGTNTQTQPKQQTQQQQQQQQQQRQQSTAPSGGGSGGSSSP
jgi:hypothetical protein